MKKWSVYIVRCRDSSLYTGITVDTERRIAQHNAGDGAKFTRSRRPVELVWTELCTNESAARKLEAKIKGWTRKQKEDFIRPAFVHSGVERVVRSMEDHLKTFRASRETRGFVPFLYTYLGVSQRVVSTAKEDPGHFKNPAALDALDVYFADLYFKPIDAFHRNGRRTVPWKTYLEYCSRPKGIPFVRLILGINAHINADLCRTIADLDYRERKDFLAINPILEVELPRVISFLAFSERDLLGFGAMLLKRFTRKTFTKLVVRWRDDAWKHAKLIQKGKLTQAQVNDATERLAVDIIRLFEELMRVKQVRRNIIALEQLALSIGEGE